MQDGAARQSGEATFTQDVKRDVRRIRTIVEQLPAAAMISNVESAMDEELGLSAVGLQPLAKNFSR